MENASLNLAKIEDSLIKLMPFAGQILLRFWEKKTLAQKKKGKLDFVTEADLAVDKFIRNKLESEYRDIPILSEETHTGSFAKYKKSDLLWIVDPLDGTMNFSRGDDNFAISVGLVCHGEVLVGAVFMPIWRKLFWARYDKKGAHLNNRIIKVSKRKNLEESVVVTDLSHQRSTISYYTDFIQKTYPRVQQLKILGSAVSDMMLLAEGRIDIYYQVQAFPWDNVAASLIVQKAGGVVTDIDGGEWNVFTPGILAANPTLHKKMLDLLA